MYQMFKDCLLAPKQIYNYVNIKKGKLILYFLLIAIIYSLPSFVSLANPSDLSAQSLEGVVEIFENSPRVDYRISKVEDKFILNPTKDGIGGQYVTLKLISGVSTVNTVILFDPNVDEFSLNNYSFNSDVIDTLNTVVHFGKDKLSIYVGIDTSNYNSGGVVELSSEQNAAYTVTYEKLGMNTIDFSIAKDNPTVFTKQLNGIYKAIYKAHLGLILGLGLPILFIANICTLLLEIVFIAFLVKILYRTYNLSFKEVCKITIFAYTPRVIFNLLSIVWASAAMYYLGQLISIMYLLIAIKNSFLSSITKNLEDNLKKIIEEAEGNDNEL